MSELVVIKPTTNLEELENQKRKYDALTTRLKMRSNDQCVAINGINNEQLYNILKANILYNQSVEQEYELRREDDIISTNESVVDKYLNKLSILSSRNESTNIVESVKLDNEFNVNENNFGVEINIPPVTPYFTPSEMKELIGESNFLESYSEVYSTGLYNFNYTDTMNEVKELYKEYELAKNRVDALEEKMISLGWNPSVEPNDKNIKLAHDRIYKDIKEKYNVQIIDIHDMNVVEEATAVNTKLKPIFITISFTNSAFGNLINKVSHSKYSHATLSLDSKLDKLYTFNAQTNGFTVESINRYIEIYDKARIKVLCTFVDDHSYKKIVSTIDFYIANKEKTKYSFLKCLSTLTNTPIKDDFALNMICSEFVDSLLKLANTSLDDTKNSNLVTPNDFDIASDTDKFYIVYEGLCKNYNKKKVDRLVNSLLAKKSKKKKKMKLKEAIDIMSKYKDILLYKSIDILEEDGNSILEELTDLLTPNPVISEISFLKFDSDGNFKLNLPLDFQTAYDQSHKLLLEYDKTKNYEGMKVELCKLWYINSKIEKKLHSKFKTKNKRKELLDIRARVLNDFKKYLTKILSIEPDFSFSSYYQNSEYYDASINIDKTTLKWSGKLLKSVFL